MKKSSSTELSEKSSSKAGRPIIENSARQVKLAQVNKRKEENGGIIKRGRPVDKTTARQVKLQERMEKALSGIEIKRGRPKSSEVKAVKAIKVPNVSVSTSVESTLNQPIKKRAKVKSSTALTSVIVDEESGESYEIETTQRPTELDNN